MDLSVEQPDVVPLERSQFSAPHPRRDSRLEEREIHGPVYELRPQPLQLRVREVARASLRDPWAHRSAHGRHGVAGGVLRHGGTEARAQLPHVLRERRVGHLASVRVLLDVVADGGDVIAVEVADDALPDRALGVLERDAVGVDRRRLPAGRLDVRDPRSLPTARS